MAKKKSLAKPVGGGGDYTKLAEGSTKLRVVSDIIDGWEAWSHQGDSNDVYRQEVKFTPAELKELGVTDMKQKQFYAMIVWNYTTEKFEVWVVTQKGLKDTIYANYEDEDWGDPVEYDMTVNRSGTDINTTYTLTPKPHSKFKGGDMELVKKITLDNLYGGGDPFSE